jgi:ABC-type phosphate transport system substrate-binding protein
MRSSLSTRLRVLLCLAAGVPVALAMGTSSASAVVSTQCSGENITGQGASVMAVAYQNVFDPEFNISKNKTACNESQGDKKKPTVSYTSSSSGAGLESWGATGGTGSFGLGNAFVVTEEPPNPEERGKIEANETTPGSAPESLLTIPVAQEAIAILVHLPTGCTATSTLFPGRLVIGNVTLQEIFLGTLKTWTSIKDGGDTFIGSTCASTITPIVRLDSAGSTHILKKYLNLINANEFETEALTKATWNDISEGTGNTVWPLAAGVKRPAKKGDAEEVAAVASTASSIGYASLANARKNTAFVPPPVGTGGKETSVFWAPIQNNGVKPTSEKFADPSTDADSSEVAEANCASEKYTNGKGVKFPPVSTQDTWQEVTTATTQKNYPICGIAYQLALTKYSAYPLTTEGEELTVSNFLTFALNAALEGGGGQLLLDKHDYEPLTKSLDSESLKGVKLIHF